MFWGFVALPHSNSLFDSLHCGPSSYKAQGRCAEAEPIMLEAIKMMKSTLGTDHPDVYVATRKRYVIYVCRAVS